MVSDKENRFIRYILLTDHSYPGSCKPQDKLKDGLYHAQGADIFFHGGEFSDDPNDVNAYAAGSFYAVDRYASFKKFWEKDYEADGFRWIDCHQEANCIYVFERDSKKEKIISLFNFSDHEQMYELKLPGVTSLKELLNSNLEIYGGTQKRKSTVKTLENDRILLTLPPFSAVYYTPEV